MLVAKPAPEEKIRELASAVAGIRPEIPVESFLLPRSESCNTQWNTIAASVAALYMEYYVSVAAPARELPPQDLEASRALLEEALGDVLGNPAYSVIIGDKRVPLTLEYLMQGGNWISNAAAVALASTLSRQLGPHYHDLNAVVGPSNPWLGQAKFGLDRSAHGLGIIQRLARLKGGPQQVYREIPVESAFLHRNKLYEIVEDYPAGFGRRRIVYNVYWTNYYYVVPEIVGWNHAVYSYIPVLFSQHPVLRHIPGFDLGPADVRIEFPDGDYSGTWEVTIDYDVTPIDRIRSLLSIGELQETVATLSAEVLELQRDRKALSEEAERLAGRLVEEEKSRRVYQVRAAQADAVARFLHQTSNLVLQPLASTMIVFEDLLEIIADCRVQWSEGWSDEELFRELDEGLSRAQEVYPTASRVIAGYRELFHAFYEVYVSTDPERDVNQDLRYIETLVRNKYILTETELTVELDPAVPPMRLEGIIDPKNWTTC